MVYLSINSTYKFYIYLTNNVVLINFSKNPIIIYREKQNKFLALISTIWYIFVYFYVLTLTSTHFLIKGLNLILSKYASPKEVSTLTGHNGKSVVLCFTSAINLLLI